jgi:hypothetical protein
MKTILKSRATGLYYQGVADWTERVETAFDFQKPERLVRFVRATGLEPEDLELVFAFDNPQYNLTLAIDERFGVKQGKRRSVGRLEIPPALARQSSLAESGKARSACRPCVNNLPPRSG